MWELKLEREDKPRHLIYKLFVDKLLKVGRKGCDILVTEDESISRKHASIEISHSISSISNVKLRPVCMLKDASSKYGTFINGKQISGEGVILKHGDLITFGQCGSNFRVSYKPLVVTTSCLDVDQKANVEETIRQLGGHVVKDWTRECTHLVMTTIKLTVKVVCALVSEKQIVTPGYVKHLLENQTSDSKTEDPDNFLPPVNEILLNDGSNSFKVDSNRSQLFKDKTFIFLTTHQYAKLCMPITLGGGKCILMNRSRCEVTPDVLQAACVIEYKPEANNNSSRSQLPVCSFDETEKIGDLLRKHKKRFIPESDIGLAVVHCSTEHYCNPDFEFETVPRSTTESLTLQSQSLSQCFMFAPETMSTIQPSNHISLKSNQTTTVLETQTQASFKTTTVLETLTQRAPDSHEIEESLASTRTKKRSASPDSLAGPVLKASRLQDQVENISIDPSGKSGIVDSFLEAETQPPIGCIQQPGPSNTSRKKRSSSVLENDNQKRSRHVEATLDIPDASLPSDTCVKDEPVSPIPVDTEGYNVDTQSMAEASVKPETQPNDYGISGNHETRPIKRRKDSSELHHHKQQEEYTAKQSHNVLPAPLGFLNSMKPTRNSAEVNENVVNVDHILKKIVNIQLADLVIQRKPKQPFGQKPNGAGTGNSPVKNFKKFRKNINAGTNHLPNIIGGIDLMVYTRKEIPDDVNEWLQGNEENTQSDPASNTSFNAPIRRRV